MPPQPGEESLVTLFADVHYYFSAPTSNPVHDRFSRGSYVYVYHNPQTKSTRLEVANHAGTPDQDAFNGDLDSSLLEQKSKQPNLVTITVDTFATTPDDERSLFWRLPAFDLKNERKYHYRIHTLDVYFWTANDAAKFIDVAHRLLQDDHIRSPVSHSEHRHACHPVVQQLEKAAISEPYEAKGFSGETAPITTAAQPQPRPFSYTPTLVGESSSTTSPAPAPYNPAAPAPPEHIAHREKTPSPPEAVAGTGLAAAAAVDNPAQLQAQLQQPHLAHQLPYFAGPPQNTGIANLPPSAASAAALHRLPLAFSGSTSGTQITSQYASLPTAYHGTPLQSPAYNAGLSAYSTPLGSPLGPQPYQIGVPAPPPLQSPAFSHYTYSSAQTTTTQQTQSFFPQQSHDDPLHGTFYVPTEAEMAPHGGSLGSHSSLTAATLGAGRNAGGVTAGQTHTFFGSSTPPTGTAGPGSEAGKVKVVKLDEKLGRVEKGVNKWLKRLDQKI